VIHFHTPSVASSDNPIHDSLKDNGGKGKEEMFLNAQCIVNVFWNSCSENL